jgi:hypothetical protein
MEAPMADPLDQTEVTGKISTPRHAAVRYRAGHECGDLFAEGDEYDGFTLTIEVSGLDDAMAMVEAIRSKSPPSGQEGIWEPEAIYLTEMDWEDPDYPLVWASISDDSGGSEYRRADLPPTPAQIMADPRVRALVEAVTRLGLRVLVAGWNGEGRDTPYQPHPPRTRVTIPTTCGVVYAIDAALAAFRAKGGE